MHLVRTILLLLPLLLFPLAAQEERPVAQLMKEYAQLHGAEAQITPEIFRRSFAFYCLEADPQRIYLLDQQVKPFTEPRVSRFLDTYHAYEQGELAPFRRLDHTIQTALERAMRWRSQLLTEALDSPYQMEEVFPFDRPWAYTLADLRARQRSYYRRLLRRQLAHEDPRLPEEEREMRARKALEEVLQKEEEGWIHKSDQQLPLRVLSAFSWALEPRQICYLPTERGVVRERLGWDPSPFGLALLPRADGIEIQAISPEAPRALCSQLRSGDRLLRLNGHLLAGVSLAELERMAKETQGPYFLEIARPYGSGFTRLKVEIEEWSPPPPPLELWHEPFGEGSLVIATLFSFHRSEEGSTHERFQEGMDELIEEGGRVEGVLLDLREANGGYLQEALAFASLFTQIGEVSLHPAKESISLSFTKSYRKRPCGAPLLILLSKKTASIGQLVAQLLCDDGAALLVNLEEEPPSFTSLLAQFAAKEGGAALLPLPPDAFTSLTVKGEEALTPQQYIRYLPPPEEWCNPRWQTLASLLQERTAARCRCRDRHASFLALMGERGRAASADVQLEEGMAILKDMIQLDCAPFHP